MKLSTAFALLALAPLASSAVTKTYRVDTGEVAYLEGAKTIDSAAKSYVMPSGVNYFFQNGAGATFTAVPPQGCQLRKDERQWALFSLDHVNKFTTLTGPTEYGQLPDNPGYTLTVTNSSTLSESSFKGTAPDTTSTSPVLILAPCFQWIRYNLVYNSNCSAFPGDYFGNDPENDDIVYTNTVVTASPSSWSRIPYYMLAGFSTNSVATEADFGLGETVQNAGEAFGVTAPQMLTNPVVRLYAVWEPRQFTVTLDPNGTGATVSPASFTITGDETCPALPVPVRFGFVSDGWYLEDGTSSAFNTRVEQGYDFPGTEDLTLYAKWIARELVITLDANGGQLTDGATTGSITITGANPCPSLPEPTRAYHDFAGWFRSDGVTQVQAGDDIEDTEPFTLYAHWDPVVRTITLDAGDGRFADGTATTNITVSGSETCPALPEPTRANYDFLRWLDGETEVKQGDDIPADVTLTAKWERKSMASYIVTLVYWNAEGEQSVQQLVNRGANAVEPEDLDTRVGYSFVKWDDSLENITSNKTITALYDPNIYSVSFDGNGGSGSVAGGYRTYDVAWELPANGFTNGDRAFLGWSTNAAEAVAENCWQPGATVSNLTAEANGTATVYAIWAATVYSVKFAWHDADGWVTNEVLVTEEHAATVPGEFDAAAWTGHTFTGWDAEIPSSVTENAILTAQYSTNAYTVSFDANGGEGTMDDQAFVYDVPQALSLNGFTRTGTYEFYCWADAAETNSGAAIFFDGATVSNLTAEAGGAVTLYAQWRDTSELSDLAKAANANFDLASDTDEKWVVTNDEYTVAPSSVAFAREKSTAYNAEMAGRVTGAGTLTFKVRMAIRPAGDYDWPATFGDGFTELGGLLLSYTANGETVVVTNTLGKRAWAAATVEIPSAGSHEVKWIAAKYDFWDDDGTRYRAVPYTVWIDEVTWTPGGSGGGPTEADRPGIASFDAAEGGFSLSVSNARAAFDYLILTNPVLTAEDDWGVMSRTAGASSLVIPVEKVPGAPQMFYKVQVVEKQ